MRFHFTTILAVLSTVASLASGVPVDALESDHSLTNNVDIEARDLDFASENLDLSNLARRVALLEARTDDERIYEYLDNINTKEITGSFGDNFWSRVHGDGKSSTGGAYHLEIGTFGGVHMIRLLSKGKKGPSFFPPLTVELYSLVA